MRDGWLGLFVQWRLCSAAASGELKSKTIGESGARKPVTFYVSKLGDNTEGTSWQKAFHAIQATLDAVPDDKGGRNQIKRSLTETRKHRS